jgi:hypothetical protein
MREARTVCSLKGIAVIKKYRLWHILSVNAMSGEHENICFFHTLDDALKAGEELAALFGGQTPETWESFARAHWKDVHDICARRRCMGFPSFMGMGLDKGRWLER